MKMDPVFPGSLRGEDLMKSQLPVYALIALLPLGFAVSDAAFAHGFNHHENHDRCQTVQVSRAVSGPANYHAVYGDVSETHVTIQNYYLRTEDGQVITVQSDPMEVNLQDLSGFSKGLALHLAQVNFPDNADQIQVAEIDVDVVKGSGYMVSGDLNKCTFSHTPRRLAFYTSQAITLGHDDYHVKVDFTALNALQLNVVTTITQKQCCKSACHTGWRSAASKHQCIDSDSQTTTKAKCALVNRRHALTAIVRAVDDNF
jgi:hypothetical protein